jgi:transketolase
VRNAFVRALESQASHNKNIFLITGDLGFGVLTDFSIKFPNQFINAGICEQNMTAVAAGMSLEGKTVFTYSIANFPTARCLEQIRNDVAYHNSNVKIVAVGAGFSYGALGITHHATEDIAFMRAIPNITVISPCDPIEAEKAAAYAVSTEGPFYIRLGRGGEPELHQDKLFSFRHGKAIELKCGKDMAILSTGSIVGEAIKASNILLEHGISCAVYSFPFIKPMDENLLKQLSTTMPILVTLEEHSTVGGLGGAVAEVISSYWKRGVLKRIGLNNIFSSIVGSQQYLRRVYGLDGESVAKAIIEIYENQKGE